MFELREYQSESVEKVWQFIREREGNPCLELPTGAGKTPVMARLASDAIAWGGRVLILAHVKELVEQNADTLKAWFPNVDVGIYSAGLKSRDKTNDVLCASIQSVFRRGFELSESRPFDLVFIDEAQRIPPDGEGMFRSFLTDLKIASPHLRVIGLTATPYRLKGGYICGPDNVLNEICHRVEVRDLIRDGYLTRLVSKDALTAVDTTNIATTRGDFVSSELEAAFDDDEKIKATVEEMIAYTDGSRGPRRNKIIGFCCGINHAHHVADMVEDLTGERAPVVTGDTKPSVRDDILARAKAGEFRWLFNVNCFTEGYDDKSIDCVALIRSTLSPGLYYQMVGRGLRIHPSKDDCLVLDFGENVKRHGCVDDIHVRGGRASRGGEAPVKTCPECQSVNPASAGICGDCGFEFEINKSPKHTTQATSLAITTDQIKPIRYEVDSVSYCEHTKKGADDDAPKTLRVSYYGGNLGLTVVAEEWICLEHSGWIASKARDWWKRRTHEPTPDTSGDAAMIANRGVLLEPSAVWVEEKPGERFSKVVRYELDDLPEQTREPGEDEAEADALAWSAVEYCDDEAPF